MEPETKRMLAARMELYEGQKFDMRVFRDDDSLWLARDIQDILEDVGWARTKVYPTRRGERYGETSETGMQLVLGDMSTRRTTAAMMALREVLDEAGLYDDAASFVPVNCIESDGDPQVGSKTTPIPCSESSIGPMELGFRLTDEVIPDDTLVILIGEHRP